MAIYAYGTLGQERRIHRRCCAVALLKAFKFVKKAASALSRCYPGTALEKG